MTPNPANNPIDDKVFKMAETIIEMLHDDCKTIEIDSDHVMFTLWVDLTHYLVMNGWPAHELIGIAAIAAKHAIDEEKDRWADEYEEDKDD